jgi:hypothetical protein
VLGWMSSIVVAINNNNDNNNNNNNYKIYKAFNVGDAISCTVNCNYRISAILYAIKTCFFRYMLGNTLNKGDK